MKTNTFVARVWCVQFITPRFDQYPSIALGGPDVACKPLRGRALFRKRSAARRFAKELRAHGLGPLRVVSAELSLRVDCPEARS